MHEEKVVGLYELQDWVRSWNTYRTNQGLEPKDTLLGIDAITLATAGAGFFDATLTVEHNYIMVKSGDTILAAYQIFMVPILGKLSIYDQHGYVSDIATADDIREHIDRIMESKTSPPFDVLMEPQQVKPLMDALESRIDMS